MRQSFCRFDRWIVADACVFLACKTEEIHRRIRDVMAASHRSRYANARMPFEAPSPEFVAQRDRLTDTERQVLYTLEFDVAVDAPYSSITASLKKWKEVGLFGRREEKSPEAAALDRVAAEVALTMMMSEMSLQWISSEIAAGALFIALRHVRGTLGSSGSNMRLDDAQVAALIDNRILRAVCNQYIDSMTAELKLDELMMQRAAERRTAGLSVSSAATAVTAVSVVATSLGGSDPFYAYARDITGSSSVNSRGDDLSGGASADVADGGRSRASSRRDGGETAVATAAASTTAAGAGAVTSDPLSSQPHVHEVLKVDVKSLYSSLGL